MNNLIRSLRTCEHNDLVTVSPVTQPRTREINSATTAITTAAAGGMVVTAVGARLVCLTATSASAWILNLTARNVSVRATFVSDYVDPSIRF